MVAYRHGYPSSEGVYLFSLLFIQLGKNNSFLSTRWLITFCTFGYAQSFGVYEDLYVLAGASTPSNIAWIGSFQLFMIFAMGLPAGKLFDAGYFHHIQIAGALLFVFSCVPSSYVFDLECSGLKA